MRLSLVTPLLACVLSSCGPSFHAVSVTPLELSFPVGEAREIVMEASLNEFSVVDSTLSATFASDNEAVATVEANECVAEVCVGEVTGVAAGLTTIHVVARFGEDREEADVQVEILNWQ